MANFWPSYPPLTPKHLTRPITRPAPRSIGDLPGLKHVTCSVRYLPLRSPPTRPQPPSHGQAAVPASVLSRACPLMTVSINRACTCILLKMSQSDAGSRETEGHGGSRCSQTSSRRRHVHAPPAERLDAICELCSEKQSQKRTTILRDTRLGDAAKAKRLAQPRKLQHHFCSHTPAFSPVCLIC